MKDNVIWDHNDNWSLWEAMFANPHDRQEAVQIAMIEKIENSDSNDPVLLTKPWVVSYGSLMKKIEVFETLATAKAWIEARRYPLWEGALK